MINKIINIITNNFINIKMSVELNNIYNNNRYHYLKKYGGKYDEYIDFSKYDSLWII